MFADNDIHTAITVCHAGSIHGAAKKLHKSQPAVSHAIKRLEDKLGFALFDRSGYRIALTAQGQNFLQRSEGLMTMDIQLQDYAEAIRKGQESSLAIAIWPMINQQQLTTVLADLNQYYPQTRLHIHYIESIGSQKMLLNEEVAIAVYPGTIAANQQRLESQVIDHIELINVISPQLLKEKPDKLSVGEQLRHWNRAIMQDSASDKSYGIGLNEGGKHWVVNDQRILSTLIFEGLAWGMLPKPVVSQAIKDGTLIKLNEPQYGSDINADIVVSRLKNHPRGPVASVCWQGFVNNKTN